ncbi:GNAT family N-acetyltransferase [Massilia sp. P8910]|uniref:GNAT family N-acetyltransferase n=1 Tax=Massilia antarctica TaxID=2765360 RepID=UPI001E376B99|nr:GNAT family N-acetyltransferase [Massilia antarctica]
MEIPWIQANLQLQGKHIELRPLEFDTLDALFAVAQDAEIWRLTSVDYSIRENFYPNFTAALKGREARKTYPFLIYHTGSSQIIGTTRFLEICPEDRKLEIGVTWLASQYWGTGANAECKYLLLEYCFDTLKANRVQFRAKSDNMRSRRALEKIGATFEGILRKDKIEPGGNARDTAFFSILNDEWPELKPTLAARL